MLGRSILNKINLDYAGGSSRGLVKRSTKPVGNLVVGQVSCLRFSHEPVRRGWSWRHS
jgi:hypothetical protein